jgi:hypothetical protein
MRICMSTPQANKQTAFHTQTLWTLDCELSILLLISQRLLVVAISSIWERNKALKLKPQPSVFVSLCLSLIVFMAAPSRQNLQKLAT